MEIIAVVAILGILVAIGIPRYIDMQANAELRALDAGVAELNGRESLTWGNIKLSAAGWVDDTAVFADMETDLGTDYSWSAGPTAAGGALDFRSQSRALTRTPSAATSQARWESNRSKRSIAMKPRRMAL